MFCKPSPIMRAAPFALTTKQKGHLILFLLSMAVVGLLPANMLAQRATLSDDARKDANKANKNFGDDGNIQVRGTTDRGLLKFKLTAVLPPGTVGSYVGKATLKIFVGKLDAPGQITVQRVSGTWSELSVTDATFPATGSVESMVTVGTGSQGKWVTADVTQLVKDWLDGVMPNDGLALISSGGADVTLDSKENGSTSHEPSLEIVLNHAETADLATSATTAI